MRTNGRSKAFFGGPLWGDWPLRYIFMDEAGTSDPEPVTVVVGIIASADEHVMSAEALVREIYDTVPPQFKKDFVFHATDILNKTKYQDGWSMTDRLALLKCMMSVPIRIGMSVCLSARWRGACDYSKTDMMEMSPAQLDHAMAFGLCLTTADRHIRNHAHPREVATVVAEDDPKMRKFLKKLPMGLKNNPIHLSPSHLRCVPADVEAGYCVQSGVVSISRIRNSVHFVEKDEDPLVQVADACAFGFRRFFANEKFGEDFARSIIGSAKGLENFGAPAGAHCWSPIVQSYFPEGGRANFYSG
ncbi:DUF3800 domain-containing protein [Hansschlegelia zhihuaiae]|uniref:DUF3800 domain-containing protein n=1 Tax=Hansschlegelia zhihuaiae TaxID=405005 RepID=A0A4Q0MNV5_9HYPH|nr:DUF3800 domain-containing protein [Hansschlegelia zhihuaiae]RXF75470.1 hypothetical protein EK403_01020 [Hansschlegelia zhihuaiae]